MADIESAIEQDQIADSLVAPLDGQEPYDSDVVDLGDGQEYAQEYEDQAEFDQSEVSEREQINGELEAELEQLRQEEYQQQQQEQQEQEAGQSQEPTPQDIQAGIQQLDQVVNELQLADPTECAQLATDLQLPANCAGPLGQVMAKTALSALNMYEQVGGDPSKVGPIPHEAAVAFSNDLLKALGVDPRMSETNPEQLASVVLQGTWNFLDSVNRYGVNAALETLNSPEGAMWFANNFLQCIGGGSCQSLEGALRLADAGGRYILSVLQRLDAQQAQQPRQSRQSQGTRSSGRGRATFQSNDDLFSEGLAEYRKREGRI